jgi:Uma2 family endonuclease
MAAMPMQISRGELVASADQRVVMYGRTWEDYETLLKQRGDRSMPRMVYLDGAIELMTTSEDHERIKFIISRLAEVYMLDRGVRFGGYGQWTMKKREPEPEAAAIEADECYRLGSDQTRGRWPDLAIEVVWTSGGLDKLEAYRRIGVREVWSWEDGEISIHVLGASGYEPRLESEVIPGIDLVQIATFVDGPVDTAIHAYRAALTATL